jgi:hypothetical protein
LPGLENPWYSPAAAGGPCPAVSATTTHRTPEDQPSAETCE